MQTKVMSLKKVRGVVAVSTAALVASAMLFAVFVERANAAAGVQQPQGTPGTTQQPGVGTSGLGELLVLDGLFGDSMGTGTKEGSGRIGASRLGELIVLDRLFDGGVSGGGGAVRGGFNVVVEPSDTLRSIARQFYGDARLYTVIAQANNITDPNRIRAGQTLFIPQIQVGPGTGTAPTGGVSRLGELIVLDSLFGGDRGHDGGRGISRLGELIVLDRLFGGGGFRF